MRILVVEDDVALLDALVLMLAREGHRVTGLEDGFELSDYLELAGASTSSFRAPVG